MTYLYFLKRRVIMGQVFAAGMVFGFESTAPTAKWIAAGIARAATTEERDAYLAIPELVNQGARRLPPGGSEGQVLSKSSGVDFEVEWADQEGGSVPYLVYRALLTQSGTDAPEAVVLENTLGGTVVWTRLGVGSYQGALTGAFTANKTFINQIVMSDNLNGWLAELFLSSTSAVTLTTLDAGTPADATITPTNPAFVEILVYPDA